MKISKPTKTTLKNTSTNVFGLALGVMVAKAVQSLIPDSVTDTQKKLATTGVGVVGASVIKASSTAEKILQYAMVGVAVQPLVELAKDTITSNVDVAGLPQPVQAMLGSGTTRRRNLGAGSPISEDAWEGYKFEQRETQPVVSVANMSA